MNPGLHSRASWGKTNRGFMLASSAGSVPHSSSARTKAYRIRVRSSC